MRSHPTYRKDSPSPARPLVLLANVLVALCITVLVTGLTALPALAAVTLESTLTSPGPAPFAGFGSALDLDGDHLVVGAPWHSDPGAEALHVGAAYVFNHQGSGTWVQAAELSAGDGDNEDYFGHAVAIDGNHIVVGAPWESDAGNGKLYRGAAYVYREKGGTWSQMARLGAGAVEAPFSFFGNAVAVDGSIVAVGAPGDGDDLGAVHIFELILNKWTETTRLDGDDPGGRFGSSVALKGDTLSVAERGGSSWRVYRRGNGVGGSSWTETDQFFDSASGFASALHGSEARVIVAAPGDEVTVAGEVHFFASAQPGWVLEEIEDGPSLVGDHFGSAVALDGHFAMVGAPGRDVFSQVDVGVAFLFDRDSTGDWQLSSSLSGSTGSGLRFGSGVAIDGTAIAVGAPGFADQESEDGKVFIYRLARAARFSASVEDLCYVTFTDESAGDITTRTWDVDGDGTVDYINPGSVFSHTYTSTSPVDVTLTVTGTGGSDSDVMTIYPSATPAFPCLPTK